MMSGSGWSAGGYVVMLLAVLVVIGLVVWGFATLARSTDGAPDGSTVARSRLSPRDILAERLAKGEIGNDEYLSRLKTLETGESKAPASATTVNGQSDRPLAQADR